MDQDLLKQILDQQAATLQAVFQQQLADLVARGAIPAATQPLPTGGANRQPPSSSGGIATNGANPQSGEQPLGGLGPIDVDEEDMEYNHYNQNEQTQWKWKDAFQPRI